MSLKIAAMERQNLASVIYRQLKQALMMGDLKPGEMLTLRSISEKFGVSQTPVREALLQLVSERLLTMTPGKTMCVPILARERLQELRDIRVRLEGMAVERALPHVTPEKLRQLDVLHEEVVRSKAEESREDTLRANYRFHFELYAIAEMPELMAMIEGLWAQSGPSQSFLYEKPFFHVAPVHPHETLLEALRNRDTVQAVRALEQDIVLHGVTLMARQPAEP